MGGNVEWNVHQPNSAPGMPAAQAWSWNALAGHELPGSWVDFGG
jgi:hypothetical protein